MAVISRAKHLRAMLKAHGLILAAFDPGCAFYIKDERWPKNPRYLHFDGAQWGWLEPLLVELTQLRKDRNR